jgi:hypothetical protein
MSDINDVLDPLKDSSRYHRNQALKALAENKPELANKNFDAARAAINKAIDHLKTLGAPDPDSTVRASEVEITIAEQFADCWGILGGVYRAQGNEYLSAAKDAYDEGNKYESSARFNILSTYNRVNRLVVRILIDPFLLSDPPPVVDDMPGSVKKTMRELLSETDTEIERQLGAGRSDRVWAIADQIMVRLLGDSPKVDIALNDLDESAGNKTFVYDSTLKVIRDLVERKLPMQDKLITTGEQLRAKLPATLKGAALAESMVA